MAWQNAANMGGNGGNSAGGNDTGNGSSQAQGTEYTLQGVMRFLQTEWHRHERDRNAWQIEKAEMKSRIGKLEGDLRTNKKLRESMDKHIRMLEHALRKRNQAGSPPIQTQEEKVKEGSDSKAEGKGSPNLKTQSSKPHNLFLDLEHEDHTSASPSLRHEEERERSRIYLGKCMEEFAYHVFTSISAQPQYPEEQDAVYQNHQYQNNQNQHHTTLDDMYMQSQQKQRNLPAPLGPSPLPNHQPPPVPRVPDISSLNRGPHIQEQGPPQPRKLHEPAENKDRQNLGTGNTFDRANKTRGDFSYPQSEEAVERVVHNYDAYGRPIPPRDEEDRSQISEEVENLDADGWNFDEPSEAVPIEEQPAPEYSMIPQRPDTDVFPSANNLVMKSPTKSGLGSHHRRKSSLSRRRHSGDSSHELREISTSHSGAAAKGELGQFKVRFALRGHLDVVRSVIFTGGGSPSAPEICTAGDDGVIKRWIAASAPHKSDDLDLRCDQTHRGHTGAVLSLAASPTYQPFSNGGRAQGDGWIFSGGEDATVRVWERGRVDPKATLDGHTDAVWTVCVLPGTTGSVLGDSSVHHGGSDRTILASGAADGTILVWSVSSPPQVSSPHTGSRRGAGGSRRANSVSSGSNFPSSPQPNTATSRPCQHSLIHRIQRVDHPSPTCISPLSPSGDTFVVSFADASVLVFNTRTAEELVGMASLVTYDGTPATGVNTVAATTIGLESTNSFDTGRGLPEDDSTVHGATGSSSGVEGMVFSGHEDRYIRFFDANSGQCTYDMLAHPAAISSLSLSPSGTELVSAGHDASLRFWSLEKRCCVQEITSHRLMRGEGVNCVVWSQDGRWVVSGGGDGVVKVFTRSQTEYPPTAAAAPSHAPPSASSSSTSTNISGGGGGGGGGGVGGGISGGSGAVNAG